MVFDELLCVQGLGQGTECPALENKMKETIKWDL